MSRGKAAASLFLALALLLGHGCGGGARGREIVEPRYIEASSGAPEVEKVTDLGTLMAVPSKGPLATDGSDGTFVVGEWILIEGEDFGKLPTIKIGDRPASSIARTRSGGIIAAIPTEVPGGGIEVEVSHPDGKSSSAIVMTRYLALAGASSLHVLPVAGTGQLGASVALSYEELACAKPIDLAMSHDGRVVYLLDDSGTLHLIDLTSASGPAKVGSEKVEGARILVTQPDVPVLVALGDESVRVFDIRVPSAISTAIAAGETNVRAPIAARLSPEGDVLALLERGGKELALYALAERQLTNSARSELFSGEPAALGRDLAFAPKGDAIWILSGNSKDSLSLGVRPTQILAASLEGATIVGSAVLEAPQGPQFLAVSRREAVMAAAAVRSTKQRAAMVMSSNSPDSLQGRLDRGQLLRIDLEGKSQTLDEGAKAYGEVVLSHDQRFAFAVTQTADGLGLTTANLDGGQPQFTQLEATGLEGGQGEAHALIPWPLAIAP